MSKPGLCILKVIIRHVGNRIQSVKLKICSLDLKCICQNSVTSSIYAHVLILAATDHSIAIVGGVWGVAMLITLLVALRWFTARTRRSKLRILYIHIVMLYLIGSTVNTTPAFYSD